MYLPRNTAHEINAAAHKRKNNRIAVVISIYETQKSKRMTSRKPNAYMT